MGVEYAKRKIQEMKPGDLVVFYIKEKKVFMGPFIVTTEAYYEDKTVIWPDKRYPWRIGIRPYKKYVKKNAGEIIEELEFIKDPRKWGAYLQGEMREISKRDFRRIVL